MPANTFASANANASYQEYPTRQLPPSGFPFLLRQIADPPKRLYLKGDFGSEFEQFVEMTAENSPLKFLCIVGPRKYTSYGKESCEKLIAGLAGWPIVIVSGLALGIDGIAHAAALSAGLRTIAIPGSGLDVSALYPRAHYRLACRILETGGLLMSELEADFKAAKWTFPSRNRLMAGISHATLVIEAAARSGTLITADLALQYNRDVLIVPGSIFSPNSAGVHGLVKEGAHIVTSSADILLALGFKLPENDDKNRAENHGENSLFSAEGSVGGFKPHIPPHLLESLSPHERIVLECLALEPLSRERLMEKSGLDTVELNISLAKLEIKGLAKERDGEFTLECYQIS